jgi:hypothetical protein
MDQTRKKNKTSSAAAKIIINSVRSIQAYPLPGIINKNLQKVKSNTKKKKSVIKGMAPLLPFCSCSEQVKSFKNLTMMNSNIDIRIRLF